MTCKKNIKLNMTQNDDRMRSTNENAIKTKIK